MSLYVNVSRDIYIRGRKYRLLFPRPMETWSRDQIYSCSCAALSYLHAHCPCQICKNKAVSRATEYNHWRESKLVMRAATRETLGE